MTTPLSPIAKFQAATEVVLYERANGLEETRGGAMQYEFGRDEYVVATIDALLAVALTLAAEIGSEAIGSLKEATEALREFETGTYGEGTDDAEDYNRDDIIELVGRLDATLAKLTQEAK